MSDSVQPHRRQPPGSPVPGILQARTLKWVAISFSNARKWKVDVKSLSRVRLLAIPWTAAHQAPPPMGFSRQEYWSGVPSSLIPRNYLELEQGWEDEKLKTENLYQKAWNKSKRLFMQEERERSLYSKVSFLFCFFNKYTFKGTNCMKSWKILWNCIDVNVNLLNTYRCVMILFWNWIVGLSMQLGS